MSRNHARELLTIEQFVSLSAKINYQLSAREVRRHLLIALIVDGADVSADDREILVQALRVIQEGYGVERRRLGTPGILHPLRAAALVARTVPQPTLMHWLCALLHDKDEDLTEDRLERSQWERMQDQMDVLYKKLGSERGDQLRQRIDVLTNRKDSYESYLGRLLDHAYEMPEILHVKLSDRLDNTFDIHLQHPGITNFNFYRAVFDIMFLPQFSGVQMGHFHFMPDEREGVMLLSQLFKDLIFLALIRNERLDTMDPTTSRLFTGLAVAGIREAQWLALEMFNTCLADTKEQRVLLEEVMRYCQSGGIEGVHTHARGGSLDGILMEIFTAQQEGSRTQMLKALFADRERLARMVLVFIVVFAAFINDPSYSVRGVGREGMRADLV